MLLSKFFPQQVRYIAWEQKVAFLCRNDEKNALGEQKG